MILRHRESGKEILVYRWYRRLQTVRRQVFAWAHALEDYLNRCGRTHRLVMIRLSYHYGEDWKPKAISEFMYKLKALCKKDLLAYVWVAEMQQRGVIHYHVILLVTRGTKIPKPDDAGIWNHGSTRIETAKSPFYICSYVGKERQKKAALPSGARVCAAYIQKGLLSEKCLSGYKAECAPRWVRDMRSYLVEGGWMEEEQAVARVGSKWNIGGLVSQSEYELVSYYEPEEAVQRELS